MTNKTAIALIQMTSVLDPSINMEKIRHFLKEVQKEQIRYVFLPECFYSLSDGHTPTPYIVEEGGPHYQAILKLARDFNVYLLGGSAASRNRQGQVVNRAYHISPEGKELAYYDKIHLFQCALPPAILKRPIDETRFYQAGSQPRLLEIPESPMVLGTTICFDVRFPEMFRQYSQQRANTFSVSAAFTVPTGQAHWHTLLKARAIENQSFVIAAAQWGQHNEQVQTYGHSLVVNPWGEILHDAKEGEKIITTELDWDFLNQVRSRMYVLRD
jgi:predicted amidohydrolase